MRLGYTIIYVPNVEATLVFYEKAFGLKEKFLHESNQYGELDTGETTLSFAAETLAEENGVTFVTNRPKNTPAGFEIALVSQDVEEAYIKAVAAGASSIKEPIRKPWGQTVAYVRDLNGVLIEICSPMD